jgi:hypothetical protein
MGGNITVESEPNVGTTFKIYIQWQKINLGGDDDAIYQIIANKIIQRSELLFDCKLICKWQLRNRCIAHYC